MVTSLEQDKQNLEARIITLEEPLRIVNKTISDLTESFSRLQLEMKELDGANKALELEKQVKNSILEAKFDNPYYSP